MTRHPLEIKVQEILRETNREFRDKERANPTGIRRLLRPMSEGAVESPYSYLFGVLFSIGIITAIILFVGWIIIFEPKHHNEYVFIGLSSLVPAFQLSILVWIAITDENRRSSTEFRKRFVQNFLVDASPSVDQTLRKIDQTAEVVGGRLTSLRRVRDGLLVACVVNVLSSTDYQCALWKFMHAFSPNKGLIDFASEAWILFRANPFGAICFGALVPIKFVEAWLGGITEHWLKVVRNEMIMRDDMKERSQ